MLFVSIDDWSRTLHGFVTPAALPRDMDLMLLGLFAATAGSGGLGNLAISNWFRDKGFGMGARVGGIGGALAAEHVELAPVGSTFPPTEANLRRWHDWWRYTLMDQSGLWTVGCAVGMFLNVNLAAAIIPPEADLSGYQAGAFQAEYMAEKLWAGFWALCLLNGFWVLFSTHLGNTDVLTRIVADVLWAAIPRRRPRSISRLYAMILMFVVIWGVVALAVGDHALSLFKVLGVMASPILSVAAIQILRVNTRFLPAEIRPPLWRRLGLLLCALVYGAIAAALVIDASAALLQ